MTPELKVECYNCSVYAAMAYWLINEVLQVISHISWHLRVRPSQSVRHEADIIDVFGRRDAASFSARPSHPKATQSRYYLLLLEKVI